MQNTLFNRIQPVLLMCICAALLLLAACGHNSATRAPQGYYYTCPMHAQVHRDKPGSCPICGMKLIRVSLPGPSDTLSAAAKAVLQDTPQNMVIGHFPTKGLKQLKGSSSGWLAAEVVADPQAVSVISPELGGRIEHLYVHYNHQFVQKGQKLFDLYSPELLSLQRQYLQALKEANGTLARALESNLRDLGMNPGAIQRLGKSRHPDSYLRVYSPRTGIVQTAPATLFSGAAAPDAAMSSRPMSASGESDWPWYPGAYIQAGQPLFGIQSLQHPWVLLRLPASLAAQSRVGDPVELRPLSGTGPGLQSRIGYVPLSLDPTDQSAALRIYLSALPEGWSIGMQLKGRWQSSSRPQAAGWYLPQSSVRWLGDRFVVWLQDPRAPEVFRIRNVKVGSQLGDWFQVLSGLDSSSRVLSEASLVQDNEIFIQ